MRRFGTVMLLWVGACASTSSSSGGDWLHRTWMGEIDPSEKMGKGMTFNVKLDLKADDRFELGMYMNAPREGMNQRLMTTVTGKARVEGGKLVTSELVCLDEGKPADCPPITFTVRDDRTLAMDLEGIGGKLEPFDEARWKELPRNAIPPKGAPFDALAIFGPSQELSLPVQLKGARLGMPKAEFLKLVPELEKRNIEGEGWNIDKDGSYDVLYSVKVAWKTTLFPNARAFLEQRWGKAIDKKDSALKEIHWLDREKHLRAKMYEGGDVTALEYHLYTPLETLFPGGKPALPAPLKGAVLGMSREELMKTFPTINTEMKELKLGDTSGIDARISYGEDTDRKPVAINEFSVSFSPVEDLHGALVKKWGKPKKDKKGRDYWTLDKASYVDKAGKKKTGVYAVYQPQDYGMNHTLEYVTTLPDNP